MTSDEQIRVLLVDDHRLLREAIAEVLRAEGDLDVIGTAASPDHAVTAAARTQPDVVLLDVEMPGNDPVRTVQRLRAAAPAAKVIILSMHDDPRLVQEMLQMGSRGYLHKGVSRADLLLAIRGAHVDDRNVTISVSREAMMQQPGAGQGALSAREHEVLTLVSKALSNRQIAGRLAITEGTVKRHLRNIFRKLDAVSRIDAVNKADRSTLANRRHRMTA
ncbi:MAG: hypothetical protein V7637_3346 [Mycobacteriales bacterium]